MADKKKWTKKDVADLVRDWREEKSPADAYIYADRMAQILEAWAPSAPTIVELDS